MGLEEYIPSRERSHITPGEKETHRLKSAILLGDMLVSSQEGKTVFLLSELQSHFPQQS